MWYLYLDESGDLGFDFVNKKPSKFFTITIIAFRGTETNQKLIKAVELTLHRKINFKKDKKQVLELKASQTNSDIKKYLFEKIKTIPFSVYSMTLNKRRIYNPLTTKKDRVYNWISRTVLDQIPFGKDKNTRIQFMIDKSKGKLGIKEFNEYILSNLKARIHPEVQIDIYHWDSKETKVLQIADMFCWGIYQEYENNNNEWVNLFKDKIKFNDVYLKNKK